LPLRPTPKISRPRLIWSTVAPSSAIRSGLPSGKTWTASPIFMFFVRPAIALAMTIGEASTERPAATWDSDSHVASSPSRSASSIRSNPSEKASASACPGLTGNSQNMPNSMRSAYLLRMCPSTSSHPYPERAQRPPA
jgi:hypothetical protein